MDDLQQSEGDGSAYRNKYYIRYIRGKKKIVTVRACGNGARRKNCERNYIQKEKGPLESQERDGWIMLKMI
jgi:hypothetical protein